MIDTRYTSTKWLKKNEHMAIAETIAMMSYNPSIGRVLKRGGVVKFKDIATRKIIGLKNIGNQRRFDKFHDEFVLELMGKIQRTSTGKKISYGHGQKPINVFLKVYVDWALYPNKKIANRLRRFLHLPLDSYVMWYIKNECRKDFDKIVRPFYKKRGINVYNLSLAKIDKNMYYAWQRLCRKICPKKPILLDVIWARAPR